MLDIAYKYEDEIKKLFIDTWYDEKYMYYYSSAYRRPYQNPPAQQGDWDNRDFVSLDSKGNVLGLISYSVDREANMAWAFGAINFSDNKATFGKDLAQVIDDIFCKFNMQKIEFCVVRGNPIERSYDRIVAKFGGSIVGIRHRHCKLIDNKLYDDKIYEIFAEDYIKAKEAMKRGKK